MAKFRYQALDSEERLVAGELEAESVQQAIAELEAGGLIVQSIGFATPAARLEQAETMAAASRHAPRSAVESERAVMQAHLARLLTESAAIVPALAAYAEEVPSRRHRRDLQTLIRVLERGDAAEAERAFERLPDYWIPLLSAAAASRDPARVLRGFLEESHQADELRRQWWLTLAYPLAVACLATAVMTVISVMIIPGFHEMFEDFGLQLPGLTKLILKLSDWINEGWLVILLALLLVIATFVAYAKGLFPFTARGWLGDRLRTPFNRATAIARLTRFTADLLEAGLSIPDALRIAASSTNRRQLRQAAWQAAQAIESGGAVPEGSASRLTATVLYALHAQMPPASRIRLLKEISQAHAERASARLSWTRGIVEPTAIVVIGAMVGIVVIALFLPLVKLVEGLSM
jgi:type II secretory pathway component PulF